MSKAAQAPAAAAPRRRTRAPRRSHADNFYERALSEAEAGYLRGAANVQGLDQEIAVLRTKIRSALEERPDDVSLLMKGIATLSRTLAARHRLADKAEKDLFDNLIGTLRGLGEQVFPEPGEGTDP